MSEVVLTEEGAAKLREELRYLKITKRPEIEEKIKIAREFGDLSENAEYDAAKDAQLANENRIIEIEEILKNVRILDKSELNTDVVMIGSKVTIRDIDFDDEEPETYTIVGKTESDPTQNKISDQSPVGKSLLGHKKGEKVLVEAPGGEFTYEILDIQLGQE